MRRTQIVVYLALAAMVTAACGTRLDDGAFTQPGAGAVVEDGATAAGDGAPRPDRTAAGTELSDLASGDGTGQAQPDQPTGDAAGSPGDPSTPANGSDDPASGDGGAGGAEGTGGARAPQGGEDQASQPNQASDVGVTETTIKVGNIVSKGGALGPHQFTPTYYGANAYFTYVNATQGGIHGRTVEYVTCDDKENAEQNIQCAQRMVEEEKVFAFVANNTRAYAGAEYVSDQGVPDILGQPIGNEYWTYPTLFGFRGGFHGERDGTIGDDGEMHFHTGIFNWFAQNQGITKAAVYYYSIPISKEVGLRIAEALRRHGVEVIEFEINPALPNFDSTVVTMQDAGVDSIFDTMDVNANRNLCDSMQRRSFSVKVKYSTIAAWSRAVSDQFSDVCRPSMWVSGESVPISSTDVPEVKRFNEVMSRIYDGQFDDRMHQWAFEGWLAAKMFHEGVERMGPAPTRQGLMDWMNSLETWDHHGLTTPITWQPGDWENPRPTSPEIFARWSDEAGDFVQQTPVLDLEGEWIYYDASA